MVADVRSIVADIRGLVQAYSRAVKVLKSKEKELHLLAAQLIEKETLTGDEVITLEPLAWHWSHWPGRLVNRGEIATRSSCRKGVSIFKI